MQLDKCCIKMTHGDKIIEERTETTAYISLQEAFY
jgi:hypothetical protein